MTQSKSYHDDEFWESEPIEADTRKNSLETYLNNLSRTFAKERSEDAFKVYLQYMIVVGFISFLVVFIAGYYSIPDGQSFSMPFASNEQLIGTFANKFEFALILGISAAAAVAIIFAALGGHAVQSQNDRLSALSDKMDHIRDRIASLELEEAIDKREKMRTASSQIISDQFYTEIRADIQEAFEKEERYNEVLDRLEAALVLSPKDSQLWHYKGIVLGKKGEFDKAIDAFDKAQAFGRTTFRDPVLSYNKAIALAATRGKEPMAEAILRRLVYVNPSDSKAQELLEKIQERRKINYEMEFRLP